MHDEEGTAQPDAPKEDPTLGTQIAPGLWRKVDRHDRAELFSEAYGILIYEESQTAIEVKARRLFPDAKIVELEKRIDASGGFVSVLHRQDFRFAVWAFAELVVDLPRSSAQPPGLGLEAKRIAVIGRRLRRLLDRLPEAERVSILAPLEAALWPVLSALPGPHEPGPNDAHDLVELLKPAQALAGMTPQLASMMRELTLALRTASPRTTRTIATVLLDRHPLLTVGARAGDLLEALLEVADRGADLLAAPRGRPVDYSSWYVLKLTAALYTQATGRYPTVTRTKDSSKGPPGPSLAFALAALEPLQLSHSTITDLWRELGQHQRQVAGKRKVPGDI